MTDAQLAQACARAAEEERAFRTEWATTQDLPDKDAAQVVMRHATALRKSLESWIVKRNYRTQLEQNGTIKGVTR